MQLWFDFLSGYDLQIQIILQIMKCDLKIKKTNQFKCDCDFDLQYCDLFQGLPNDQADQVLNYQGHSGGN